jgi:arabinan endo-1,5-alpha-L-arabinosidase
MKKLLFVCLFTAYYSLLPAQQGGTPEQRAQRYLDGPALAQLNLSADQKSNAFALLVAEYRLLDSLVAATAGQSNEALQPKRLAIMQAQEAHFKELLNQAQKTMYNTLVQARPQGVGFGQLGGAQQGNRTPFTPEMRAQQMIGSWMLEPLNLTAEQKTKAQGLLVDTYKSLDAITAGISPNLPPNERQAQMAALAPKMAPVRAASEKKFIALLNGGQKKAYAETVKLRPQDRGFAENFPMPLGTYTKNPDVHDPVMAKEGDTYYVFATNGGIISWSSKDLVNWKKEAPVFTTTPAWVPDAVPGFRGTGFWAPDIILHNGKYHLYYSASSFGKNSSAIGLITNKTLNPSSPDYKWEDQGMVVQSIAGRDQWNAIDPNIAFDENGTPWLSFGSFWNGIKMVKLEKDLKTIAKPETWSTISSRAPGSTAVEAPFIFKKGGFYYLFVSWDRCCQGTRSDYNIRVGRSEKIAGPYLDKDGVDMAKGGGTLVLGGDTNEPKVVYALGHNAAYTFDGIDYLVYHKYVNEGAKLGLMKISWKEGWPVIEPQ